METSITKRAQEPRARCNTKTITLNLRLHPSPLLYFSSPTATPPSNTDSHLCTTMETSLRYDSSSRSLSLFAKERFTSSDDLVLTVRAFALSLSRSLARSFVAFALPIEVET